MPRKVLQQKNNNEASSSSMKKKKKTKSTSNGSSTTTVKKKPSKPPAHQRREGICWARKTNGAVCNHKWAKNQFKKRLVVVLRCYDYLLFSMLSNNRNTNN